MVRLGVRTSRLRAQMQRRGPVFFCLGPAGRTTLSAGARASPPGNATQIVMAQTQNVSIECTGCPTLAASAASLIAPPSRALLPARPVRELLHAMVHKRVFTRDPLGPRRSRQSVTDLNLMCACPIAHIFAVPSPFRTRFVPYARARRSVTPYAPAECPSCVSVLAISSMR